MLLKQTKIVATISDQRCDVDFIKQLFDAGMNVVRMNTAHLGREGAEKLINNVRTVSNRIAILMDTKGPEVRTTVLAEPIPFKVGDRVKVVGNPEQETTRECISVSYSHFVKDLDVDGHILIDDGDLELIVVEKTPDYLLCEVQNEATLGSRKSVNVPGVRINLPSLTEKDRTNILYAIEKNIDFIAHSFVRNKQDILDIKSILDAHNSDIRIVAKIENQEGVDNIDEILEVADEKTPDGASAAIEEQIKEKEAERVRKVLKDSAYTIALAIDGKQMTSENFAEKIQGLGIRGESHICFLIGGSLGMSDSLLRQADERISFSKMTFPHQLMRVILLEQIYRGFRIIHHEPYHK